MTPVFPIDASRLLPQQEPFRFVDKVTSFTEERTCTTFEVKESPLTDGGEMSAGAIVEHMAQSCAARTGYICVYILHIPVSIGYIGQVRDLEIRRFPTLGEELRTEVDFVQEVFGISLCRVSVYCGDELVARGTLKTALKDD